MVLDRGLGTFDGFIIDLAILLLVFLCALRLRTLVRDCRLTPTTAQPRELNRFIKNACIHH
jgi:hypothetical protein